MSEESKKKVISSSVESQGQVPRDILIVTSKLKKYVKVKHGINTSASVAERLSDIIRARVDEAIVYARSDGRKTLMDRDFK